MLVFGGLYCDSQLEDWISISIWPPGKSWWLQAPKMTKDDYLKLAPVGAAFAAGQVGKHAMA